MKIMGNNMMADIKPRLLTTKQAASYLNISPSSLYNLCYRKEINPFLFPLTKDSVAKKRIKISKRFDRAELDNFISRNTQINR
jgi:predicted DNA-binding transcriptional regulator AlpA